MDKFTFGDSLAAIKLAELLTNLNDKNLNSIVHRVLTYASHDIKAIKEIKDKQTQLRMFYRTKTYYKELELASIKPAIKTFFKNVLDCKFKKAFKEIE